LLFEPFGLQAANRGSDVAAFVAVSAVAAMSAVRAALLQLRSCGGASRSGGQLGCRGGLVGQREAGQV